MNIAKVTDLTFLPKVINIEDDLDIQGLNEAAEFCNKHKFRSLCTYAEFVPYLKHYINKLSIVIDFPDGRKSSEDKIYEIGSADEKAKHHSSSSEMDLVINPEEPSIDLEALDRSEHIKNKNPIKLIIGLCVTESDRIKEILDYVKNNGSNYIIKTNTGRENKEISFQEKYHYCSWLKQEMNLRGLNNKVKVSGGIQDSNQMKLYTKIFGDGTIFGISFSKIRSWKEFSA